MKTVIVSDFREILESGLAAPLSFGNATSSESVLATVEETTITADLMPGGVRPKRTFSATLLAEDLCRAGFSAPRIGGAIRYGGDEYRIRSVKRRPEFPLVQIEFSEK